MTDRKPPLSLPPSAHQWARAMLREQLSQARRQDYLEQRQKLDSKRFSGTAEQLTQAAEERDALVTDSFRAPGQVTGVGGTGLAYWNTDGAAVGRVDLAWDPVEGGADGAPIGISRYEVWGRKTYVAPEIPEGSLDNIEDTPPSTTDNPNPDIDPDADLLLPPEPEFTRLVATTEVFVTVPNLTIGQSYTLRVRAISAQEVAGDFSDDIDVVIADSLPAMAAPTDPIVSSALGVVTVEWDGLLSDGTPPSQFSGVFAEVSTTENGVYTPAGQNLLLAGKSVIPDLIKGSTYWVHLVGIDRLSQKSAASNAKSVVVKGVDLDSLDDSVTDYIATTGGGNTITWSVNTPTGTDYKEGDVWWQRSNGIILGQWEFTGGAWVARTMDNAVIANLDAGKIVTGELDVERLNGVDVRAKVFAAGKVTADDADIGDLTAAIVTSVSVSGVTITGTTVQSDAAPNLGVKLNNLGLFGFNAAGTQTFKVDADTGNTTIAALTATDAFISGHIEATSGEFTGEVNATGGNISGTLNVTNSGRLNVIGDTSTMMMFNDTGDDARIMFKSALVPLGTAEVFLQPFGTNNEHVQVVMAQTPEQHAEGDYSYGAYFSASSVKNATVYGNGSVNITSLGQVQVSGSDFFWNNVPVFYDSGWINMGLGSGFSVQGNPPPGVRKVGATVYTRGLVTGPFTTGKSIVAAIPVGFAPSGGWIYALTSCNTLGQGITVTLQDDGYIGVYGANGKSWVSLAGFTWTTG